LADQGRGFNPKSFGALFARDTENYPRYVVGKAVQGRENRGDLRYNVQDYTIEYSLLAEEFGKVIDGLPPRKIGEIWDYNSPLYISPSYWRDRRSDRLLTSAMRAWSAGRPNVCETFLEAVNASPDYSPALKGAIGFLTAKFGSLGFGVDAVPTQVLMLVLFLHLGGNGIWGLSRAISFLGSVKNQRSAILLATILAASEALEGRDIYDRLEDLFQKLPQQFAGIRDICSPDMLDETLAAGST
jgi:hypothetical protein